MPESEKQSLEPLIRLVRDHRVILDADLAKLYGVATMRLNEAVKRNSERFPSDFAFQLTPEEMDSRRSQIVTSSDPRLSQIAIASDKTPENTENPDSDLSQFAIGSQRFRNYRLLPWAFTEHGALMAATILRSPKAVQMSLYVVRAFVKLREIAMENQDMSRRMAEAELALREHDALLADVYDKLEPLLEPPSDLKPDRPFGFRANEPPA